MDTPLTRLAEVIKADLAAAEISENSASKRTGIPRTTLRSRLATGDFSYGQMWQLAGLLDTTPAQIAERAERAS